VSDVLVNGYRQNLRRAPRPARAHGARFKDDAHLMRIIEKIVSSVGRASTSRTPWSTHASRRLARERDRSAARIGRAPVSIRVRAEASRADLVKIGTMTPR